MFKIPKVYVGRSSATPLRKSNVSYMDDVESSGSGLWEIAEDL